MTVIVRGYVPHRRIGEMVYQSAIYHVFEQSGHLRFLVWNPFKDDWEVVDKSAIKPVGLAPLTPLAKKQLQAAVAFEEADAAETAESRETAMEKAHILMEGLE